MSKKMNITITLILSLILSITSMCYGEVRFEFDKNMSTTTGTTNMKTVYDLMSKIQVDNIINLMGASGAFYLTSGVGHEIFGHGYVLRLHNLDANYHWPFRVTYKLQNPSLNSDIAIGGLRFNREFENEFLKDGINHGFTYRNSVPIFWSKYVYFATMYLDHSMSDTDQFTLNSKKINSKTNIDHYLRRSVNLSILDPSFIMSVLNIGDSIWNNGIVEYNIKYLLPTVNFNLYNHAVTTELGVVSKIKDQFYRLTYEFGHDIWNEKIKGVGFECSNISLWDTKMDIKVHRVESCEYSSTVKIGYRNVFMRWKHHITNDDNFSFGLEF